jgi:aspartate-semialdehyde dehydrogenase
VAKLPVGVLGGTGAVGQRFIQLLESHPWFEVAEIAASDRSAGKPYAEACTWRLAGGMPEAAARSNSKNHRMDPDVAILVPELLPGQEAAAARAGARACRRPCEC